VWENILPDINPESAEEAKALGHLLRSYRYAITFQHQQALDCSRQVIAATSPEAKNSLAYLHCRARLARGLSLTELGQHHQALEEAQDAGPLLERLNLPSLRVEIALLQGLAHRRLGEGEQAAARLQQALETAQTLGDELLLARVEDVAGLVCLDRGELDKAELHFQRALARRTRHRDQLGLAATLGNLSRFYATQEKYDLARSYLDSELAICEIYGALKGCIVSLQEMARLAARSQDWSQAQEYLRRADQLLEQVDSPVSRACQAFTWADYYLAREEWPEAEKQHRLAAKLFGPDPGKFVEVQLEWQAARLAAAQGQREHAQVAFAECRQRLERLNRPASLARLEFDWGMWLLRDQRPEEAVEHVAQAILFARDLQVQPMVKRFVAECRQIGTEHWLQALLENKKLARELATKTARLEKFAVAAENTVHDLKDQIVAINAYLKKVEKKVREVLDPHLVGKLKTALYLGLYMERWATSFLDGIKAEECLSPRNEPLPWAPLVQEFTPIFALNAEEKSLTLNWSSEATDLTLLADPRMLRSVLFNLIDNAFNHTPKGRGAIRVEVTRESGFARVKVIDHGEGIPEELQERIFEKWGRVEKAGQVYSTGLGLYHARKMVEAMGGKIGVISKVGEGSTFWFTVPLAEGADK